MLKGRTALVTGSTLGIGLASAMSMAQAGAHVVVHGIETPAQGQPIAAALEGHGVRSAYVQANLAVSYMLTDEVNLRLFNNLQQKMNDTQGNNYMSNSSGMSLGMRFCEPHGSRRPAYQENITSAHSCWRWKEPSAHQGMPPYQDLKSLRWKIQAARTRRVQSMARSTV